MDRQNPKINGENTTHRIRIPKETGILTKRKEKK